MESYSAKQIIPLWLTLMVVGVTGCQSSPQLVKGDVQKPVTPLAFTAEAGSVELAVTGLIAYDRPGSWVKQAYWDEYNVRVENHRLEPIVIEEIILGDVLDRSIAPGIDPWVLEKMGHEHEQYLKSLCASVDVYQSAHPPSDLAKTTGAATALTAVALTGPAAPLLVGSGVAIMVVAATPVALVDHAFFASQKRERVLAEFNRRRLSLPIQLEPGTSVAGSVFFPLTPGPERLTMRGRAGEVPVEVAVALPGLEALHFTFVTDKAALKAAKPYRGFLLDGPRKPPVRKALPASSAESR
jgi:hypothetical protein